MNYAIFRDIENGGCEIITDRFQTYQKAFSALAFRIGQWVLSGRTVTNESGNIRFGKEDGFYFIGKVFD